MTAQTLSLGGGAAVDGGVRGVDHGGPDFAKFVVGPALFEDHLHGRGGGGEAQRSRERRGVAFSLVGGFPLAVDAGKAARVEQAIGGAVDHLEVVAAEIRLVDPAIERPRPGAFQHDGVEGEVFFGSIADVDVVDPHGARRLRGGDGGEEDEESDFVFHGGLIQDSR